MSYLCITDVYSVNDFDCYCVVFFVGQNLLTYINFMRFIIVFPTSFIFVIFAF